MYVRFWGTRGSIATPGPQTTHYGGNTACVEVRSDDGTSLVLDCGTGARELGWHLMRTAARPIRLHLLLSHTHWDHIQGFPFFDPAFLPDTDLHLYAPRGFHQSLEDALAGQMQYPYFPVTFDELRSRIRYTQLEEGCVRIGSVRVDTQYLNHTAPALAYRLSSGGTTIAYVTEPMAWTARCRPLTEGQQRPTIWPLLFACRCYAHVCAPGWCAHSASRTDDQSGRHAVPNAPKPEPYTPHTPSASCGGGLLLASTAPHRPLRTCGTEIQPRRRWHAGKSVANLRMVLRKS